MFHYETTAGEIKHNYGYTSCLSASFVIKAGDFERTNGFPNIWAWGLEDFLLQERALAARLTIDRSRFLPSGHKEVLQFFDGNTRDLSGLNIVQTRAKHKQDGLGTLSFQYSIEGDVVHVDSFSCAYAPDASFIRTPIEEINRPPSKRIIGIDRILK
jgi:hypothetical protein